MCGLSFSSYPYIMTGQQRTSETQALDKRHIVDNYITPLPFFPKRDTPVKKQNTGAMSRSSPVHGVHRVVMKVDDSETWLCIGDSVIYRVNAGEEPRVGRVVEIYLCEEFETTGVAITFLQLLMGQYIALTSTVGCFIGVPSARLVRLPSKIASEILAAKVQLESML